MKKMRIKNECAEWIQTIETVKGEIEEVTKKVVDNIRLEVKDTVSEDLEETEMIKKEGRTTLYFTTDKKWKMSQRR